MKDQQIEVAAKRLAEENARFETTISRIYWFPDPEQIRLVEVDSEAIMTDDDAIMPFYFNPVKDVPFPSGVALIHPEQVGKKSLPSEWQTEWSQGKLVYERTVRVQ